MPHTADLRIEAWGRTREECIAEAVRGLVESFAEVSGTAAQQAARQDLTAGQQAAGQHLTAGSDADLLAAAVDEVIYRLDAGGEIPVTVTVSQAADGGIDLGLRTVDAATAEIIGAAPKAASLSGLRCAADPSGRWSCAVTVDV